MLEPADFTFEAGQWVSVPFGPKIVRAWTHGLRRPPARAAFTLSIDVAPGGIGLAVGARRSSRATGAVQGADRRLRLRPRGPAARRLRGRGDRDRPDPLDPGPPLRDGLRPAHRARSTGRATPAGSSTTPTSARSRAATRASRTCRCCASRPRPGAARRASPPRRWIGSCTDVDKLVVYVCGGGETINRVRDALVTKGMDRKSVKWEKFW